MSSLQAYGWVLGWGWGEGEGLGMGMGMLRSGKDEILRTYLVLLNSLVGNC